MTPAQRLWRDVLRDGSPPALDQEKVLELVDSAVDRREALAVRLRFGFWGEPLLMAEVGKRLPRADGGVGVSREMARRLLDRALARLRHPSRRRAWWEAVQE